MRTIGVVTVGRSDYGIYRPVLERIRDDSELELRLYVSGMHLSPEFGLTVAEIEADGFPIAGRIEMLEPSDDPEGIARSMGRGTSGFAAAFARSRPDVLLVLGDRFEMHAGAVAAVPFLIPIAHVHGGESTEGAIDEQLRHSLTKLAHLHFASTEEYARRIVQMGEEPWRVVVSGAPALDSVASFDPLDREELVARHGIRLNGPPLLVTYHPVTLEYEQAGEQVRELLAALDESGRDLVFTCPNADTGTRAVQGPVEEYAARNPRRATLVANLGSRAYFTLMQEAAAMVGNSSSGIVEAASFKLPVVNVGTRQQGRLRAANVIDVGYGSEEILGGIRRALSAGFRESLAGLENPYGDGRAAERIVARLKEVELGDRLLRKRFHVL